MRHIVVLLGLGLAVSGAKAGDLSFQVTNSGQTAVTGITVTGGDSPEPILVENAETGPGETSEVAFAVPADLCVFDLTIKLANRDDVVRPEIDLCQLQTLIIE